MLIILKLHIVNLYLNSVQKCGNFDVGSSKGGHLDGGGVGDVAAEEALLEGAEGQGLPEADHHQVDVAATDSQAGLVTLL